MSWNRVAEINGLNEEVPSTSWDLPHTPNAINHEGMPILVPTPIKMPPVTIDPSSPMVHPHIAAQGPHVSNLTNISPFAKY